MAMPKENQWLAQVCSLYVCCCKLHKNCSCYFQSIIIQPEPGRTWQNLAEPGRRLLYACGRSKTTLFSFVLQPILTLCKPCLSSRCLVYCHHGHLKCNWSINSKHCFLILSASSTPILIRRPGCQRRTCPLQCELRVLICQWSKAICQMSKAICQMSKRVCVYKLSNPGISMFKVPYALCVPRAQGHWWVWLNAMCAASRCCMCIGTPQKVKFTEGW